MKRHVLSNGENNSVLKIQNISVNQEICGWKRLKHKIQNTSVQYVEAHVQVGQKSSTTRIM